LQIYAKVAIIEAFDHHFEFIPAGTVIVKSIVLFMRCAGKMGVKIGEEFISPEIILSQSFSGTIRRSLVKFALNLPGLMLFLM
jgi:hypothetical protein